MAQIGAVASRLEAILVGGARMFSFGSSETLDIGRRNEEATRAAARAPRHLDPGGGDGRQQGPHGSGARAQPLVTVKEPGAAEVELFAPGLGSARRAG